MGHNRKEAWKKVANMPNGAESNALSWGDALFLHIERPGQPLNIAGVSIFEGEIKLADCRAYIESKLPLIPRYRQRVVSHFFRSWSSELGVRSAIRHSESRSRGNTQARDEERTQGARWEDREREPGPAAAAVGFHSGAAEGRAHRTRRSNPSLSGGRNCWRWRDECHHGYHPDPASDLPEENRR